MKVLTPPTKPFMIALGTSHTNGDCEGSDTTFDSNDGDSTIPIGIVPKTAHMMIAEELGLELVQIGLSGCINLDLLSATNELAHHGFLNDNCKLFMLEPRIVDATMVVPINAVYDKFYKEAPRQSQKDWIINDSNKNRGIIAGFGSRRNYSSDKINAEASYRQQLVYDGKVHQDTLSTDIEKIKIDNNKLLSAFRDSHAWTSNSPYQYIQQITYIDAIKNIVKANNINFVWQLVMSNDNELSICEKFVEHNSDLFKYLIDPIVKNNEAKHIKCPCGHFNQDGHNLWFSMSRNKVKEIMELNH